MRLTSCRASSRRTVSREEWSKKERKSLLTVKLGSLGDRQTSSVATADGVYWAVSSLVSVVSVFPEKTSRSSPQLHRPEMSDRGRS